LNDASLSTVYLPESLREALNISKGTLGLAANCISELKPVWDSIDEKVLINQAQVLESFVKERISLSHMLPSTGYGYQDTGREGLDRLYARVFGGESALVRLHWASGTCVLKTAFFSLLRPGDEMLCVTGTPYETLLPIIGLKELKSPEGSKGKSIPSSGSLADFKINYRETSCLVQFESGVIDEKELESELAKMVTASTKVIFIQRSRGYTNRKTTSIPVLKKFMEIKEKNWPSILTIVDNCYCEFADTLEPPALGITLTVGSLIKNPGGGLAPSGGYVVGKRACVERVAESLYAPGLYGEVGSNPYGYRDLYQGLFLGPKTVGEALKGACFASLFFKKMGYEVDPEPFENRSDIVQAITLKSPETLKTFAKHIQLASPVDSFATPEPWDMPGYEHRVIMAAGTFVQGSSIELSCDAPFTPPYTVYLQGGLTKEHVILACMKVGDALMH